ncbi:MAG: hypothetical protein ACR2QM_11355, partial [Longimicrobiales bacterium]
EAPGATPGTEQQFWTDGALDEWFDVRPIVANESPSDSEGIEVLSVAVAHDRRFVHFLLELSRSVNAQAMRGSIEVLIDGDGSASTGAEVDGLDGVDAVVVLSRPATGRDASVGSGVGVRMAEGGSLGPVQSAGAVGLVIAPTHSSRWFELRLRRGVELGGQVRLADSGGTGLRGAVRYVDGGTRAEPIGPFDHQIAPSPVEANPPFSKELLTAPVGTYRVVAWNVSDDFFKQKRERFQRILNALQPQVVLLDEVYDEITPDELDEFFAPVGSAPGRVWEWSLAEGGGRQRTVVASGAYPVSPDPLLRRIDYDPSELSAWAESIGGSDAALAKASLESEAGLSAMGAWVEVDGVSILHVPLDFESRGYDGSPEDQLRVLQARTLNRRIHDVVASREDVGLVIGGDLNLVGSDRPLWALADGLGFRGDGLGVAHPLNAVERSLTTWRSTGNADAFSPGRLDFVLYRHNQLSVVRAFVFDSGQLDDQTLAELGVLSDDSWEASEHLPIVVDFQVVSPAPE